MSMKTLISLSFPPIYSKFMTINPRIFFPAFALPLFWLSCHEANCKSFALYLVEARGRDGEWDGRWKDTDTNQEASSVFSHLLLFASSHETFLRAAGFTSCSARTKAARIWSETQEKVRNCISSYLLLPLSVCHSFLPVHCLQRESWEKTDDIRLKEEVSLRLRKDFCYGDRERKVRRSGKRWAIIGPN